MTFKDHFSGHARSYAESRPGYPDALFAWLAGQCQQQHLAWDCATGNGQAARSLATYFDRVIASDGSAEQIAAAPATPGIEYKVWQAEDPALEPGCTDLISVAQALHWFDHNRFFAACDRALASGGVLAVWSYGLCQISESVDALVDELYSQTLDDYWPPERRLVEQGYAGIEFPFTRLEAPDFAMRLNWSAEQFMAYLRSWSATQRYLKANAVDPVAAIEDTLLQAWGDDLEKPVCWPLTLMVCRK